MKTTIANEFSCPHCKKVLGASTDIMAENTPKNGDFSICAYCATVSRFKIVNHVTTLEDVSKEEMDAYRDREPAAFDYLIALKAQIIKRIGNV